MSVYLRVNDKVELLDMGGQDVMVPGTITATFASNETGTFVPDDPGQYALLWGHPEGWMPKTPGIHVQAGDCRAVDPPESVVKWRTH